MALINRDPDKKPDIPDGMLRKARERGECVFSLAIDDGDDIAHFFAMSPFRPIVGDKIKTEDGKWCVVSDVCLVSTMTDNGVRLLANVFAEGPNYRPDLPGTGQ